jgi:dephospho-CoA kinase
MLKIGLTGGIGSGKSTVARIFEVLGIPIYYADKQAKWLMQNDRALKDAVKKTFGDAVYPNEKLDRKYLANLVFNNKEKLETLNRIVHPFTIADAKEWMASQTSPYAIKEAALLFESGSQIDLDLILGVFAPQAIRINRTIKRDQTTREQVLERMKYQLDPDIAMKLCDFCIHNDEQSLLITQVLAIHEQLLLKSQSPVYGN